MSVRPRLGAGVAVAVALWFGWFASSCGSREEPPPIRLAGRLLTVENRTPDDWQNVEVWVNDHYRVTKPSMAAGEQFVIPLDACVAGFGQRFDPKRQVVQGVEVTARSKAGASVTIIHGRGRRR
jgi:hypothetical protein